MKTQVRINESGALQHQRFAFSNRFTLVTELLQNARRAGATRIDVDHDAGRRTLVVHDDGRGLDDFQKLLSLHESGWDADLCAREHPFGIGFSKCLYDAHRCIVASGRQRVDIDTAAALARCPIEVEERPSAEQVTGTRVELHGVDLADLESRIEELCTGFAVPVWFNGVPLPRPMAEAALPTCASAVGRIHLAGLHDGKATHDTWVFLQGLCVMRPAWSATDEVNVVHLDPTQFTARLPDRDRLIDEDVQRRHIDAEVKSCWRRALVSAKAHLTPQRFIERFHPVLRSWGQLDLLNDLDLLPANLCRTISGYPVQAGHDRPDTLQPLGITLTRQAVESGEQRLVVLHAVDDGNGARWMLARHRGWTVFDWMGVDADHWAMRQARFLEHETATVTPVGERLRTTLEGRGVWPTVILCDAVRIAIGDDEALVTTEGVAHDGTLYIPGGEASGRSVAQLSAYQDDHDVDQDADRDADREALADLLFRLRSTDPQQTMESLLVGLHLGKYPVLHGRMFRLVVGTGIAPGPSVELMEAADGKNHPQRGRDDGQP